MFRALISRNQQSCCILYMCRDTPNTHVCTYTHAHTLLEMNQSHHKKACLQICLRCKHDAKGIKIKSTHERHCIWTLINKYPVLSSALTIVCVDSFLKYVESIIHLNRYTLNSNYLEDTFLETTQLSS